MTDANDVPICTCFDDWHANNAGNHALTCPVIAAFATLTSELDDARRDVAAMRKMLATAFREGWNCGDWKEDRDNVSAREYDWNHSAVKAKADAALTQGDA